MAMAEDFNLLDAFRMLDIQGKGVVEKSDLKIALGNLCITASANELILLFTKLDQDKDGFVKYSEFANEILPSAKKYADMMQIKEPDLKGEDDPLYLFSKETKYLYKKLIIRLIDCEAEAEYLRIFLNQRPLFSLYDAFLTLDQDEKGFIAEDEFEHLLSAYGIFVNGRDLNNLMKRFDQNKDGKISYSEFF